MSKSIAPEDYQDYYAAFKRRSFEVQPDPVAAKYAGKYAHLYGPEVTEAIRQLMQVPAEWAESEGALEASEKGDCE